MLKKQTDEVAAQKKKKQKTKWETIDTDDNTNDDDDDVDDDGRVFIFTCQILIHQYIFMKLNEPKRASNKIEIWR